LLPREDGKVLEAINTLIKDIKRDPVKGFGKPEPLKHALQGWWSRRITGDHRLVYRVTAQGETQPIDLVQCKYHYWARSKVRANARGPQDGFELFEIHPVRKPAIDGYRFAPPILRATVQCTEDHLAGLRDREGGGAKVGS
jgi:toxin YoeB